MSILKHIINPSFDKGELFCHENVISGQIDLLGNEKEMLLKDWYVMIKQSEAFLS